LKNSRAPGDVVRTVDFDQRNGDVSVVSYVCRTCWMKTASCKQDQFSIINAVA